MTITSYEQLIATIYVGKPAHWPRRILGAEKYLGVRDKPLDEEAIDIEAAHRLLFVGDSQKRFTDDVLRLKKPLHEGNFAAAQPILDALQFAQSIIATAMWKYAITVGDELEAFARDYDRLDTEHDRKRLYQETVSQLGC